MSSQTCTNKIRANGYTFPCGKCGPCRHQRQQDVRATTAAGINHHQSQRLLFITVTPTAIQSDLQRVRWNMHATKLRNLLAPRIQSALTARKLRLPLAWAAGYSGNGSIHFHMLILLPDDHSLTTNETKRRVRRAIRSVAITDTFDLIDQETGEIQTVTMVHRFGRAGTDIQLRQSSEDIAKKLSGYLSINATDAPWETVPTETRTRLHRIAKAMELTPRQIGGLGYSGHLFRVSRNWGSTMQQRREERQRYAVEKQRQADLAADLAVLTGEDSCLDCSKWNCVQHGSESGSQRGSDRDSQRESESTDTVIDLPTQTDESRIHEVTREGVYSVSSDLLSDSSSENFLRTEYG